MRERQTASKLLERQMLTERIHGAISISEEKLILDVVYYYLVGKKYTTPVWLQDLQALYPARQSTVYGPAALASPGATETHSPRPHAGRTAPPPPELRLNKIAGEALDTQISTGNLTASPSCRITCCPTERGSSKCPKSFGKTQMQKRKDLHTSVCGSSLCTSVGRTLLAQRRKQLLTDPR